MIDLAVAAIVLVKRVPVKVVVKHVSDPDA
jgi:hypothetical protein